MPISTIAKFELPTIFVIFGITGDLVRKKILKALFNLHRQQRISTKFKIYGFGRKEMTDETLRSYLKDILIQQVKVDQKIDDFLKSFFYVQGDFNTVSAYNRLAEMLGRTDGAWRICSNKLFYLSVPPRLYSILIKNLHDSGLTAPCSPEEGWTRVILEKPFGSNLQSAKELDLQLSKLFKEEQIYRVDHYLAKETIRNILAFRFSNSFFTPAWNNKSIEKIEIKFFEEVNVSKRGEFYDSVGALRDVGQNHILQMLALFLMRPPRDFTPKEIKKKRSEALASLHIYNEEDVASFSIRGQYQDYKKENGVDPDSNTETYFKIKTFSDSDSFRGVPIYLESGKSMSCTKTEIIVTFKHPTPCLCPPNKHQQNKLYYQIKPDEKITLKFLVKQPGLIYTVSEQDFGFDYQNMYSKTAGIGEYEALLFDIIKGDQTLFVSTNEVMSQWKFIEPFVNAWSKNKPRLFTYEVGSGLDKNILDDAKFSLAKEIAVVGLGKMGRGIALSLHEKGWKVNVYNRTPEKTKILSQRGVISTYSIKELVAKFTTKPRIIWLMLPAGEVVESILFGKEGLTTYLKKGDIVVEAGNSYYKDAKRRADKLKQKGIQYVDVGLSGGPKGARRGACLMVGGPKELFELLRPLYQDLSIAGGVAHFEGYGAGHAAKMVHNGIEYGMMQSIGEGLAVLKALPYNLDLKEIASVYNHGSVIESRLIGWLEQALEDYGNNLDGISGSIAATGEGEWTVNTAKEYKIPVKVIEESFLFRKKSQKKPSYTGKVVSALRGQFGGHEVKEK